MQRRSFIRNSGFVIGALLLIKDKAFARLVQEYKMRMLTKQIGIFTEKGGTILFYISKDGIVVVDSQFPESAGHLITELKKKELPFRLLINTHHHADHTAGNIAFKDLAQHVLSQANAKFHMMKVAEQKNIEDKQIYPDQTFDNAWNEKIGKEYVRLHYFGAAHTNGDCLVEFSKSRIVHLGDLVFNRKHPFVDKSAGASISNWIKVLDQTIAAFSKKTKFVCGHSAEGYDVVIGHEDILAFKEYLRNVLLFTSSQISLGKTRPEILKVTEIPGSPEWKGEGADRALAAAYTELTASLD